MILKDALPGRKVKIELHVLDQNGKTLDELESDSRNESFLDTWGSMEYDYMIPLTKRYILYLRKGAENESNNRRDLTK